MKQFTRFIAITLFAAAASTVNVFGIGTPAGTDIENVATIDFKINGVDMPQVESDGGVPVVVTVDELLDVDVTTVTSTVTVTPGQATAVTQFTVTNTGNGTDRYTLTNLANISETGLTSPNKGFNPAVQDLYIEDGTTPGYQSDEDIQYDPTLTPQTLAADEEITVYIVSTIPLTHSDTSDLLTGDEGDVQLIATSETGSGAAGTVVTGGADDFGASDGTGDAIVGANGGDDTDTATYLLASVTIIADKSATMFSDPFGNTAPNIVAVPGSVITYEIQVSVTGSGTAENVTFTDSIPDGTVYKTNTLLLDGNPQSETNISGGVITLDLGDIAAGSPIQTVSFQATINDTDTSDSILP